MMPTCALNRDFQVQQAASRSRGWAWEEQNHTLSFQDRDPEEESRGACFDISVVGNTP